MSALTTSNRKLVDIDSAHHRFRVNRDAYRSAEIFEREKQLIFSKCWLYVGHASELAAKVAWSTIHANQPGIRRKRIKAHPDDAAIGKPCWPLLQWPEK